jgi:hypothetical protein
MIKPLRQAIHLALLSALLAGASAVFMPWIVRISMTQVAVLSLALAGTLALSSRTHPVRIQRSLTRINGRVLRAGSVIVGLTAFKVGAELYGGEMLPGFDFWLLSIALLHFSLAWWDRQAFGRQGSRWRYRRLSVAVHAILSVALGALHLAIVLT